MARAGPALGRAAVSELLAPLAALYAGMLALFAVLTAATTLLVRRLGEDRLRRWMGGTAVTAPLKGLVVGAVTPFCSWSSVPVLLGLLRARVRVSAVAAFYLASPVLDPVLVVVLAVLFGVPVAAACTAILAAASLAGAVLAERRRLDRHVLERVAQRAAPAGCDVPAGAEPPWAGWRPEARGVVRAAAAQLRALLMPLAFASAVAVAVAGAVPRELVVDLAGPGRPLAVPTAAALGVPLYLPTEALAPLGWGLGSLGLDVYEEEADLFFEDLSDRVITDDVLTRLLTFPNVLITGHQAFFTAEALERIAHTTLANVTALEPGVGEAHVVSTERVG